MTDLADPQVLDGLGRPLQLGRRLGRGGEGTVYALEAGTAWAAKIYHQPMTPQRVEKIRAMLAMRPDRMGPLAAWPVELLVSPPGAPVGIKLPRLAGCRDIHQLYSPKSRRTDFPRADWRFLVRVAANLARAFAAVHATPGVVIADVNHSGVLVAEDGRVCLIDCDGFQVRDGERLFPCELGVAIFTPPELQGMSFAEVERTANHDAFGLAVLVFLLLFMGRHPFAGRYRGGDDDMPVERAIAEYRFAYRKDHAAASMERPPGTPSLAIVSPHLRELFERAFSRAGSENLLTQPLPQGGEAHKGGASSSSSPPLRERGWVRGQRPTAAEWAEALDRFEGELVPCVSDQAHHHFVGLTECPWCRMESAIGVPLFSDRMSPGAARQFDFPAFWREVAALEHPGPAPTVEDAEIARKARPSPAARAFRRRRRLHVLTALLAAAVPVAASFLVEVPPLAHVLFIVSAVVLWFLVRQVLKASESTIPFVERARELRERWERLRGEWVNKAGLAAFEAKRTELDRLKGAWTALAPTDVERAPGLEADLRRTLRDLHDLRTEIAFARTSMKPGVEQAYADHLQAAADLKTVGVERWLRGPR